MSTSQMDGDTKKAEMHILVSITILQFLSWKKILWLKLSKNYCNKIGCDFSRPSDTVSDGTEPTFYVRSTAAGGFPFLNFKIKRLSVQRKISDLARASSIYLLGQLEWKYNHYRTLCPRWNQI